MKHPGTLKIADYTYELPDDKIAAHPLEERDASKLLIWKDGVQAEDSYANIAAYLPQDCMLVFNQTKVVHARLLFKKDTGGVIEVFCLEPDKQYPDVQTAMLQKNQVWWKCMVGGASKWKPGAIITLQNNAPAFTLSATVVERNTGYFVVELSWDTDATFAEILHHAGKVPLPPYMQREPEKKDEHRYQTIYAKHEGSVAAPTAGLHFTERVMDSLHDKGIDTSFVTLHVGAGTFRPVKAETMHEHDMHAEWIEVDVETIQHIINHLDNGVFAVGTTSMRTLESLYWIGAQLLQHIAPDVAGFAVTQWLPYELVTTALPQHALQAIVDWLLQKGESKLVTRTQIIIAPGYTPKVVKGLITNFHQPQSTLLLLVAAIAGDKWRDIYDHALSNNYRFLSYGDGCLLFV